MTNEGMQRSIIAAAAVRTNDHLSIEIGHWSFPSLVISSFGFFSFFFSINCIRSEKDRRGFLPSSCALVSGLTTLGLVGARSRMRGASSCRGGPPCGRRCGREGGPCCGRPPEGGGPPAG